MNKLMLFQPKENLLVNNKDNKAFIFSLGEGGANSLVVFITYTPVGRANQVLMVGRGI